MFFSKTAGLLGSGEACEYHRSFIRALKNSFAVSETKKRALKQSRQTYLGPDPEVSVRNKLGSLVLVLPFQVAVQHANTNPGQSHHEGQELPQAG